MLVNTSSCFIKSVEKSHRFQKIYVRRNKFIFCTPSIQRWSSITDKDLALFHEGQTSSRPVRMYAAWPMNKKKTTLDSVPQDCVNRKILFDKLKRSNMIIMACHMCANDESNSHLKWLAGFLSLISCGTNRPQSQRLMCFCVCVRLTFSR